MRKLLISAMIVFSPVLTHASDIKIEFIGVEVKKDGKTNGCGDGLFLNIEKYRPSGSMDLSDLVVSRSAAGNDPWMAAMSNKSGTKSSVLSEQNGVILYSYCAQKNYRANIAVKFMLFSSSKQSNTLSLLIDTTQ